MYSALFLFAHRGLPGLVLPALAMVAGWSAVAESAPMPDDAAEVLRVASEIDQLLETQWSALGVTPGERAGDAEYLRRVSLHVGGCIPAGADVRRFLADPSPDKRMRVVEELLDGPEYVVQFTRYWRRALLPESELDAQSRFLLPGFESWLREQLIEDVSYDALVAQILNADLDLRNPQAYYNRLQSSSPLAFYHAREAAPENLAAATSRTFLGVRIECAQCHDHPFDRWGQEDFWSYAAFFAGIVRDVGGVGRIREIPDRREIAIAGTEQVVQASHLDGSKPRWRFQVGPRETLAEWMTSPDNELFARAAVNRLWGHFFGAGIVEPIDDFSEGNPPSHPELLDLLGREFVAHGFDMKFMIRAITASRAYQLSSRQTHETQSDPRAFARMHLQGLTPEQLYDSLAQATGVFQPYPAADSYSAGSDSPQGEFLELFAEGGASPLDRETTILQSLAMMNGRLIADATSLQLSRTVGAVATATFLETPERVEALYFAALSRPPRAEELERTVAYVESGGPTNDPRKALADVFWALLNSTEFLMNH